MGIALRKSVHQTASNGEQIAVDPSGKTKSIIHRFTCSELSSSVCGAPVTPGILTSVTDPRARDLLRTTWVDDFGSLYDLGTDIYNEIFRLDPSTKKLFKALDGYDLEKDPEALRQCAGFCKQALRFIQTVSMTVRNCSRLYTIDDYLQNIGRRHVQYKHQGFEPRHWHVFETAMSNVIEARAVNNHELDEADRRILADAYRQLSRHIVASMTAGFRLQEKEEHAKNAISGGGHHHHSHHKKEGSGCSHTKDVSKS